MIYVDKQQDLRFSSAMLKLPMTRFFCNTTIKISTKLILFTKNEVRLEW